MKKIWGMVLLFAGLALAPLAVTAQSTTTEATQPIEVSEVVEITYDRALQLAMRDLLALMELDALIEEIEERLAALAEDINAMEQGNWRLDTQTEWWGNIAALESQIRNLQTTQEALTDANETMWQDVLHGLTLISEDGAADSLAEMLYHAMMNMIFLREVDNAIFSLQSQRDTLFGHLGRLNRDVPELLEDARQAVAILQWQIEILRTQQTQARLEREALLRRTVNASHAFTDAVVIADMELALLEEALRQVQVRQSFGMNSMTDVRNAEFALARARVDSATLRTNQRSMQQGLNHLLGLPLTQNTVVVVDFTPQASTSTVASAHTTTPAQLTQRINATPTAQRLRLELNIARELEEGLDLAEARLDHAIQAMELAWQQAYNDRTNLLYQYALWQLEQEMATAAYEAALVQLALGRLTAHDVDILRYQLCIINSELATLYRQLWLLDFLLANPAVI